MKKIYITLLFISIALINVAQDQLLIDSLKRKLTYVDDSSKIEILLDLTWNLRNSNPEKSVYYGQRALELASNYSDQNQELKAYSFIGVAYRIMGNYNEAIDYFYEGLHKAKQYGILEQEGYAFINIGNLHIYQEHYNNALENLKKALEIATQIKNPRMLAYANLNLGRSYFFKQDYNKALKHIREALALRLETDNVSGQAVCYKYIGDIYCGLEEPAKALMNYKKSLETVDKDEDKDLVANIYLQLATVYKKTGNPILSEEYANKSLALAQAIGARLIIKDAYLILAEIHLNRGAYKKTAEFYKQIIHLNDTLYNQQLAEKIFELEYRFEKQKREAEIDILNKDKHIRELKIERNRIYIITLLVILLLLVSFLVYILISYRERQKKNALLEKQKDELTRINTTKDKMFMVIGHDLKGPIGNIVSWIDVLREEKVIQENKSLVEIMDVLMISVESVYDLLGNLLLWAKSQQGDIPYAPERLNLNDLIQKNIKLFKAAAELKKLCIKVTLEDNFDVFADANMIQTVLRNLLSNALKYTPEGGHITVYAEKKENKVVVSVKDTGVGFNEDAAQRILDTEAFYSTAGTNKERGSGIGLNLSHEFIKQNDGELILDSKPGKGSVISFILPAIER